MYSITIFKHMPVKALSLLVSTLVLLVSAAAASDALPRHEAADASKSNEALDYVAIVNNKKIPMDEFQLNVDMVKNSYYEMGFRLEDQQLNELKKIILESLIEKELLLQESRTMGIEIDPATIETEIDTIRDNFPDAAGFEQRITEMGYTLDFLRHEIGSNMTIEALIEQELASKVNVSDEEVESYYDSRIESFRVPEQIKARHILIRHESGGREKIEEIMQAVNDGEDFEELASMHSDCPSGQNGGDLGYFSRGQMVEPFEKAAFALEIGEVSDIVETRFGFHIIKTEDQQAEEIKTLEDVKDDVIDEIRRQEVASRLQPYIESLKQKYDVEIMLPEAQ